MKNEQLTNLDTDQINKRKFDEMNDADRVYLVGGANLELSIDSDKIANAVKEGLSSIEFKSIPKSQEELVNSALIQTVKENVFIPQIEIKTIEVPVIIKEIEYKTIEIPVITEKIVTIEKPVVIKEIEFKEIIKEKEVPKWQKICIFIQTIAILGLLLSHILK